MKDSKIKGSLIGGAIGDALGFQIEFKRGVKDKEVTRFKNGRGLISDDTQMTLFTANSLLWRETRLNLKGIAPTHSDAMYLGYSNWLDGQVGIRESAKICWIRDIEELNIPRAPGGTCVSSLVSGKKGTIEKPINNSKGCGGVMRVAPLGLYMKNSLDAGKYAAEASAITHGHPLGIMPSYIFATMIYYLVNEDVTIEEAVKLSIKQFKDEFNKFNRSDTCYMLELLDCAIKLSKSKVYDQEAIYLLGEGWSAEEALAIAVYSCLKYSNSFEDAIICSVNHDGDSDSTGAIAGNIMGAYLGIENIPDYYLNNVELKDEILEIAEDLSVPVPVSEYSENNDKVWLKKYAYCKKAK